jgi:hypothetical protein
MMITYVHQMLLNHIAPNARMVLSNEDLRVYIERTIDCKLKKYKKKLK